MRWKRKEEPQPPGPFSGGPYYWDDAYPGAVRARLASSLCDHRFVTRSYYWRVRPGRFRRHRRWCLRCVACHEYIGQGPIPSKPPPMSWRQRRAIRQARAQLEKDERLIEADFLASGKEWDDYYDELVECWRLDLYREDHSAENVD